MRTVYFIALLPIAWLYALIMRIRAWCYLVGVIPSEPSGAYVVSIGNIQVGGTGKTPFVVMLANRWKQHVRLGIVSRGYGRETTGVFKVDLQMKDPTKNFGDEPVLIAENSGVPVYVGESRVDAARELIAAEGTRLILLDDGFQHLKLRRSFDIVLVDVSAPEWHWNILPAGRLRESPVALRRADLVVMTKIESADANKVKNMMSFIRENLDRNGQHQAKILAFRQELSLPTDLNNKATFLVAGLARPTNFFDLVRSRIGNVVGELAFRDHFDYSVEDVLKIKRVACDLGASAVLTTEKDHIKLKKLWCSEVTEPSLSEISLEVARLNLVPNSEEDKVGMELLDAIILDQTRILSRPDHR